MVRNQAPNTCRLVTWLLTAAAVLCLAPTASQGQARTKDGYLRAGATGTRIGFGLFAVRNVTTDADGNVVDDGTSIGASLNGGLAYALHPRLALDADLDLMFGFEPELDLLQVELTPGARFFMLPALYARGAYAIRVLQPRNQLFLLGAGYYLGGGSVAAFLELNYVVWSQNEVDSPFIPRLGIELHF